MSKEMTEMKAIDFQVLELLVTAVPIPIFCILRLLESWIKL